MNNNQQYQQDIIMEDINQINQATSIPDQIGEHPKIITLESMADWQSWDTQVKRALKASRYAIVWDSNRPRPHFNDQRLATWHQASIAVGDRLLRSLSRPIHDQVALYLGEDMYADETYNTIRTTVLGAGYTAVANLEGEIRSLLRSQFANPADYITAFRNKVIQLKNLGTAPYYSWTMATFRIIQDLQEDIPAMVDIMWTSIQHEPQTAFTALKFNATCNELPQKSQQPHKHDDLALKDTTTIPACPETGEQT